MFVPRRQAAYGFFDFGDFSVIQIFQEMAFDFVILSIQPLLKNKVDDYSNNQYDESYFWGEENIQ